MTVEPSSNGMGRRWWLSIVAVLVLAAPGWGQTSFFVDGSPLTSAQKQLASQALDYWMDLLLQAVPPVATEVITRAFASFRTMKEGLEPKNNGRVRAAPVVINDGKATTGAVTEPENKLAGGMGEHTSDAWVGQEVVIIEEVYFGGEPPCEDELASLGVILLHEGLHVIQNFKTPSQWKKFESYNQNELRALISACEAELEAYTLTLIMISVYLNRIDAILEDPNIPEAEKELWESKREEWVETQTTYTRLRANFYGIREKALLALL